MAHVTFNNPVKAIRGRISGLIFRPEKHPRGFNKASADGHAAANLHPIYAELAKAMNQTAYNIALSDWMYPPVIHRILVRDNKILIQASDNVMVAKVEVMILDEQGKILERGEGNRIEGDWWEYVPECIGTIRVEAWDLAGNVTKSVV